MTLKSDFFDTRAVQWEERCYPPPVRERLAALIPAFGVRAGERVLDLGTGPGVLIPYLLDRVGASGGLWAMDLSFQMTRQARLKMTGSLRVVQADAHVMPFETGVFDRVICFAAFPHFHDGPAALAEMARIACAGADIVVSHLMSRAELAAHHAAHAAVEKDILPDGAGMRAMFAGAGLEIREIVDEPGRYLAMGKKMR